jgi:hypothetical protein
VTGIFDKGVREDIDLRIKIPGSPYVTRAIFVEYVRTVPIPAVEGDRSIAGCQNKPAILFCDNCASHCSDEVKRELAEHGVLLLTYPPHTSHIFQVPDRLLFGCLKSAKERLSRDLSLGRELDHAPRIFRGYESSTTSLTVGGSWEKTGFEFERRDGTWYLVVNEGKIRASPEFAEVWGVNHPEEQLSARRRQQPWGWINRQFFRVRELRTMHLR